MAGSGTVLGLVGSPNRDGRTYQMVRAALAGAAEQGVATELIQMADHVVEACKDCLPWECQTNRKCSYPDPAFEFLSQKLLDCGALVLGTPIYWWDTSGMVRYLMLKMFRVFARSAPLAGIPAFGIGVAGGTGNGLVSGLRPVYHFFQVLQMRAITPLPVTRFNWEAAVAQAGTLGACLAGTADRRHPFAGVEDRLLWFDQLPYLSLTRAAERRVLAAQVTAATVGAESDLGAGLARADLLAAHGAPLDALCEITRVYEAGVKTFEAQQQKA